MDGDLARNFGHNMRAHREAQGLSQEDFAHVLGIHRTFMGSVERGERNLTLRTVEKLAGRADQDPLSLLGGPPPSPRTKKG
jgi:transcriptional regulator with XRE-family HTH domain